MKIFRHVIYFIVGASLCSLMMGLVSWDEPNTLTQYKLIAYGITMTGLFVSCAMHEKNKT